MTTAAATLCPNEAVQSSVRHLGLDRGYSSGKVIGKGSFGAAVLVKDREGKDRVMKVIDLSGLNPRQRQDSGNEPEIMKRLRHPYIVRYRESFLEKGVLAIVMDFAGAGNVLQQVEYARSHGHKSLPEQRVINYTVQVLLALKHMHSLNIIHRDLKNENLFLETADHVRIGDFGLARVMDRSSSVLVESHIVGTPYYLSPEICSKGIYSPASDMWALGCMLYELLALGVPFDATNLPSLMMKITTKSAPQLPVGPGCPSELATLCSELLAKSRSARPAAAEALKRPLMRKAMEDMLDEAKLQEAKDVAFKAPPAAPQEDLKLHVLETLPPAPPSGAKRLPPLEDAIRSKASLAGYPLDKTCKQSLSGRPLHRGSLAGYAATQKFVQPKAGDVPQHKLKRQLFPVTPINMSEVLQQAGGIAVQSTRERAVPETAREKPSRPRSASPAAPDAAYQYHLNLSRSGAAVGAPLQGLRELKRSSSALGLRSEAAKPTPLVQVPRLKLNPQRDNAPVSELDILTDAALPPSAWISGRKDPVPLPSYRGVQRMQRSKSAAALPDSSRRPSSRRPPAGLPPPLELARAQDQAQQGPAAPRGVPLLDLASARSKSGQPSSREASKERRSRGESKERQIKGGKGGPVERGLRTALRAGRVLAGGIGLIADAPLSSRKAKELSPLSHPNARPCSASKRSPSAPGSLQSARGTRPSGVVR